MKKEDFITESFNADLNRAVANQPLDFCSVIKQSLEKNLSVTGIYYPLEETPPGDLPEGFQKYVTLNHNLEVVDANDPEQWYYGVSPLMDKPCIVQAVSDLRFQTLEGVDDFIRENSSWFTLHANQAEYLLELARYIVLSVAANIALPLQLDSWQAKEILSDSLENSALVLQDDEQILLRGCPPEQLLERLSKHCYKRAENNRWTIDPDGIKIQDIYADPSNLILTEGSEFYSGVLLRPLILEDKSDLLENERVDAIVIHFERSTFATVYALDHNFTSHPFMIEGGKKIVELLREDDERKHKLICSINDLVRCGGFDENILDVINDYLCNSFNVNQIGVSANIITSDNLLLLGCRDKNTYDENCLYPSVNGNAELADEKVSFYKTSMHEDYPTINLSDYRMDFLGEIGREAYAELRLDLNRQDWVCYGIAVSGNRPSLPVAEKTYNDNQRRLHFNILFEQHIDKSILEVEQCRKKATEKYENKEMLGIEIHYFKNKFSKIQHGLLSLFNFIKEQNDLVDSILVFFLFLWSIIRVGQVVDHEPWYTTILAVIIIISAFISSIQQMQLFFFRKKSCLSTITIYEGMTYEEKNDHILSSLNNYCYHPIAYASIKTYIDNMIIDEWNR